MDNVWNIILPVSVDDYSGQARDSGLCAHAEPNNSDAQRTVLDSYLAASQENYKAHLRLGHKDAAYYSEPQSESGLKEKSDRATEVDEAWRTKLLLTEQTLAYERFRRLQYAERNRRLFGELSTREVDVSLLVVSIGSNQD